MARPVTLAISALLLLAATALLWPLGPGPTSGSATLPVLRLGLPAQAASTVARLALDTDPAHTGVVLEHRHYVSGKRALSDGLLRGEVDVVTTGDIPFVAASFEHPDLVVLASIATAPDAHRIVARRDHGITAAADLRGKTVGVQADSAIHFFASLFLARHGIEAGDATLRALRLEDLVDALDRGAIDAASLREPLTSRASAVLGPDGVVFAAPGLYERTELVVARRVFVDAHAAAVDGLLRALLAGLDRLRRDPAAATRVVASWLEISSVSAAAALAVLVPDVALDQSLLPLLEAETRWVVSRGPDAGATLPAMLPRLALQPLARVAPHAVTVIR